MTTGNLPKWLGIKLGEASFAIALDGVLRVYYYPAASRPTVEAQEGYPVFVVPAAAFLSESMAYGQPIEHSLSSIDIGTEQLNWVIVLKSDEASKIGFRVEKTFGPFTAEEDDRQGVVAYEEMVLRVVKPLGGKHG